MKATQSQVLIYAANLHTGGGVQVAASFLNELFSLECGEAPQWRDGCRVLASTEVAANLSDVAMGASVVANTVAGPGFLLPSPRPSFDVAFSVFGPTYRRRMARAEIAGFADPTVALDPHPSGRLRERLKRRVKKGRLKSVDHVVVETDAMADCVREFGVPDTRISVVPNAVARDIMNQGLPPTHRFDRGGIDLLLLYPARPYAHKNHNFLGPVAAELLLTTGIRVKFAVTLTSTELGRLTSDTQEACIPLGVLNVDQLASAYTGVDGVFFPSLLEVFSATPIESLALGCPLLASDRDFVREIVGDAAGYFDPEDPASAAAAICSTFSDPQLVASRAQRGFFRVAHLPTAKDRALRYIEIIDHYLSPKQ
jgi:glycosyltransferase involved in cell wall biosynthesis